MCAWYSRRALPLTRNDSGQLQPARVPAAEVAGTACQLPVGVVEEPIMIGETSTDGPGVVTEWTDWDSDPDAKAADISPDERKLVRQRWRRTIVASCIEPEGPRRLFGVVVPELEGAAFRATLHRVVNEVTVRLWHRTMPFLWVYDDAGSYLPGAVLRDVIITMGGEIFAIVKITESGAYVVRLPRADLGRELAIPEDLRLDDGANPVMEMIYGHSAQDGAIAASPKAGPD
jgi:hypothetical protein